MQALVGAVAVATLMGCGLSLTIALVAVRLDLAGFSAHAIGLNTAAGGVATLASAPFIPKVAKRTGVPALLLGSLLLGAAALLGFAFVTSYAAWLVLRFVLGVAVTVMFVLSEFWITSIAPPDRRGVALGAYGASLALGFASGPLLLAVTGTSGALPFHVGAALFLLAACPLAFNARSAPMLDAREGRAMATIAREAPVATLAALLHGAIEVAGMSLLPVYALRMGFGSETGALFAGLFILGNAAFQLPIGWIADKVDRRKLLLVLALAGAAGAAILATAGAGGEPGFGLGLLVWGGIVGAFYPIALAQLGSRYRGSDLASANAACVTAYAIGMLLGPPSIGVGLDAGPAGFFWTIALMVVAYSALVAFRLVRERDAASNAASCAP